MLVRATGGKPPLSTRVDWARCSELLLQDAPCRPKREQFSSRRTKSWSREASVLAEEQIRWNSQAVDAQHPIRFQPPSPAAALPACEAMTA